MNFSPRGGGNLNGLRNMYSFGLSIYPDVWPGSAMRIGDPWGGGGRGSEGRGGG